VVCRVPHCDSESTVIISLLAFSVIVYISAPLGNMSCLVYSPLTTAERDGSSGSLLS